MVQITGINLGLICNGLFHLGFVMSYSIVHMATHYGPDISWFSTGVIGIYGLIVGANFAIWDWVKRTNKEVMA